MGRKRRSPQAKVPRGPWPAPAYKNPLLEKLGGEFFKTIPQQTGVYFFKDDDGDILYVGKAKNLRARLRSYSRAKPTSEARKVLRMIDRADTIEWEVTRTEKEALLRENSLLRELDPEFNVLNTSPERYYFIGIQVLESQHPKEPLRVRFKLTRQPERDASFTLFGCFRSSRRMKAGYAALLRIVWAALNDEPRFLMPSRIARHSPPYNYLAAFREEWLPSLESFFEGRSPRLLSLLIEAMLANPHVPAYMYKSLQNDLETALDFFKWGPRVNRKIRITHRLTTRTIPQDAIDDYLVHERVRRGLVSDEPLT